MFAKHLIHPNCTLNPQKSYDGRTAKVWFVLNTYNGAMLLILPHHQNVEAKGDKTFYTTFQLNSQSNVQSIENNIVKQTHESNNSKHSGSN